jgi:hypothetical protein
MSVRPRRRLGSAVLPASLSVSDRAIGFSFD